MNLIRFVHILLFSCGLIACSSEPQPVQPDTVPQVSPILAGLTSMTTNSGTNYQGNPETVTNYNIAIAGHNANIHVVTGHVMLKMETFPVGLAGLRLRISQNKSGQWKKIEETTSGSEGAFSVSAKLYPGSYRVQCKDKRYKGTVDFTLEDKPISNLLLEVERADADQPAIPQ